MSSIKLNPNWCQQNSFWNIPRVYSQEYTRGTGKLRHSKATLVCLSVLCLSVSAKCGMFHPYYAWGGELLGLASLRSTDNQWLGSLRHLHQQRGGCHTTPQLDSASSVFPAYYYMHWGGWYEHFHGMRSSA